MNFIASSTSTRRKLLGNNLAGALESAVNNSITRHTPWDSPVPVHNPNTSYGLSYNADYGKSSRIKDIGKHIVEKNFEMPIQAKSQALKINTFHKPLKKVADNITDRLARYGRKISPLELNHRIEISEVMFDESLTKRSFSPKVSPDNADWLSMKEKKINAEKFIKGEFIPNMNQFQLYGRKAEKSKFEQRGLWIVNKLTIE